VDRVLDRLWIGSTRDADAPLTALGFTGVLDLRDGRRPVSDDRVLVIRVVNRDGDPWTAEQVNDALDFAERQIKHGRVLIMCDAAMSRSVAMTIGYLVRTGWDVGEAYEAVRRARPKAAPRQKMLASVLQAVRP
jgi:predicted protein tyrosine phosphatase